MSAAVRFTVYCTYYMYMQKNIYATYYQEVDDIRRQNSYLWIPYRRELFSQVCKQVDLSDIFPKTF